MSFITNSALQGFILDALKKSNRDLDIPDHIPNIAAAANARAYNEIQRRLLVLGYSQTQIDLWDHGAEFQRDLGLFFAFTDEGLQLDGQDTFLKMKDRRQELDTLKILLSGGVPLIRVTADAEFGFGALDTSRDEFVRNPNDRRIGRATHW